MSSVKQCTKCSQILSLDSFSKHNGKKASKTGYRATCKNCDVAYNREYRSKNRAKVNERKRQWAATNPDKKRAMDKAYVAKNKDRVAERLHLWNSQNKEHLTAYRNKPDVKIKKAMADKNYAKANPQVNREASRKYRANNPDKTKVAAKKYRQSNPEIMRIKSHRRRVILKSMKFLITKRDVQKMLGGSCSYCPEKATEIDHVIPLARNGRHSIGNLTGACRKCNASKGALFVTEWKKKSREAKRY